MVIWLCLRWWYGDGWQWAMKRAINDRLRWCNETFSILALVRTWFAPFKQTYTQGSGSIDLRIHAFFDNVISRAVGFVSRTFIILAGLVASLFALITGVLFIALWPMAPVSLPLSLILMVVGWGR